MADRVPLATPGRIDEIDPADRVAVAGVVNPSGNLTFEDASGGPYNLSALVGGGGGGDLQAAYDASAPNPEIVTDATRGALQLRRGSAADSDRVLEVQNGAGSATAHITGAGVITGANLSGTNTGDQTITLTGDVTGSGTGSFAATISADAVTYAKMQNASAASILLGRGAGAGAGDLQEIVLGTNLSMTGTTLNAATGGSGEANTASNVGATGTGLFKQKTGVNLEFYKIDGVNGLSESVISDVMTLDGVALLPRDGSRAMTAALDMGGNVIAGRGYTTISPTAIAAQANDYAPTGIDTADRVRLTLTGNQTLTGIVAPTAAGSTRKLLINIDTTDALTIPHDSASSTAANRFFTPGAVSFILQPRASVFVEYDATSSRWRVTANVTASTPTSTTADRVPSFADTTGSALQQTLLSVAQTTGALTLPGTMADTSALMTLSQSGTNGGSGSVTMGSRNPTGNVTGAPGALYVRVSGTTSSIYQHRGSGSDNTSWVEIGNQYGRVIHEIRRSVQIGPITTTVFPAYDSTIIALDTTYWTFSSGTWTCAKAHRSTWTTRASYQVNSGYVDARAKVELVYGAGVAPNTQLQAQNDSAYSTTDLYGHITMSYTRDWAVNDQVRVYYSTTSGGMDILANSNNVEIRLS